MCGRYTLANPTAADLRARFPLGESVEIRRRYNVAPGDDVVAVTRHRDEPPVGELLRWGLVPFWVEDPAEAGYKMINARAETLEQRPAYRDAFERRRCLIIADGFYEWQATERGKQPFHIARADGTPFAFAGLRATWRREGKAPLRTCAIVTAAAPGPLRELHDRVPVILPAGAEELWLDPGAERKALRELLEPLAPAEIAFRPVSKAVNDARYDGPDCLAEPVEDQPALF